MSGNRLKLGSIHAPPNAGQNITISTYNWGRFGEADIAVLRESLATALREVSGSGRDEYSVHVIVTRYAQAFSNESGATGCVIDFAVRRDSVLVFTERFFAGRDFGRGFKTLGGWKDVINGMILNRIVRDSALVADGKPPLRIYEATFNSLDELVAILPARVTSAGAGGLISINIGSPPSREVPWRELLKSDAVDWNTQ